MGCKKCLFIHYLGLLFFILLPVSLINSQSLETMNLRVSNINPTKANYVIINGKSDDACFSNEIKQFEPNGNIYYQYDPNLSCNRQDYIVIPHDKSVIVANDPIISINQPAYIDVHLFYNENSNFFYLVDTFEEYAILLKELFKEVYSGLQINVIPHNNFDEPYDYNTTHYNYYMDSVKPNYVDNDITVQPQSNAFKTIYVISFDHFLFNPSVHSIDVDGVIYGSKGNLFSPTILSHELGHVFYNNHELDDGCNVMYNRKVKSNFCVNMNQILKGNEISLLSSDLERNSFCIGDDKCKNSLSKKFDLGKQINSKYAWALSGLNLGYHHIQQVDSFEIYMNSIDNHMELLNRMIPKNLDSIYIIELKDGKINPRIERGLRKDLSEEFDMYSKLIKRQNSDERKKKYIASKLKSMREHRRMNLVKYCAYQNLRYAEFDQKLILEIRKDSLLKQQFDIYTQAFKK